MVAAGAVISVVTPAFADIAGLSSDAVGDFHPGESHQLKIHATGTGSGTVQLSGLTSDFDVTPASGCKQPPDSNTSCSFTFTPPAGRKDITFTITAHQNVSVGAGQSTTVQVTATGDGQNTSANFKLFGATATQGPNTVSQVSGTVKDTDTGQPISGAVVGLQDSASPPHTYSFTTDGQGRYVFRGSAANPIAPGIIAVDATKDGYKSATKNATVQAGQTFTFSAITLQSTATPTATPSAADPAAGASTGTDSAAAAPPATTDVAKNGGSGFSTLLIVLGAVLVLLGIGAIVFILVRRRRDDGEGPDELDETGAPQRGPTPVPASRGAYRAGADPTAAVRSGGYGDPTMVGGMADAPTMMQSRPPVDEYRDPYGAPTQPAYGGGYDDRAGYDERGGYEYRGGGQGYESGGHRYDDGRGYDNGYGDRGGYDDRRGGYDDRQRGGYDERGGGHVYGGDQNGYDDRGGYDDQRGGYDDRQRGGYDDQRGGYDDRAGYDERGGYGDRHGYDHRGGGQGYESPAQGYEAGGQGHDAGGQSRPNPPPDSRRQLGWLDD